MCGCKSQFSYACYVCYIQSQIPMPVTMSSPHNAKSILLPPPPQDNHRSNGQSSRHPRSGGCLFDAIRKRRFRQLTLLVEGGGDPNARNENGETPLIFCCKRVADVKTRLKFVRFFLEVGVDPNLRDWNGMTALIHATILGFTQVVLLLLEYKRTDPEIQDSDGYNALMYAAASGHAEIVAFFLNRRLLHPDKTNNSGETAFNIAIKNHHDACAQILARETQRLVGNGPSINSKERIPTPIPSSIVTGLPRKENIASNIQTIHENIPVLNETEHENKMMDNRPEAFDLKLPEIATTRCSKSSGGFSMGLNDVLKNLARKRLEADNRSYSEVPFLGNLLQMQNLSVSEETLSRPALMASIEDSSKKSSRMQRLDSQDLSLPPIRGRLQSYDDIFKSAPFIRVTNE